jgi:hypothetical protein
MAAPLMHAAVPGSSSLSNTIVRALDPLTRASTPGDIRALAALATALSAALMLLLLRRNGTPISLALLLSCSILTAALPVSTAMTAALALQMLFALALLLIASTMSLSMSRVIALAIVTVLGSVNHASFLPFAAIVWIAAAMRPYPSPQPSPRKTHPNGGEGVPVDTLASERGEGRVRGIQRPLARLPLILIGLLTLAASLTMTAWLIQLNAAEPITLADGRPGIGTLALALITGRFASELQPIASNAGGLKSALAHVIPGPAIVWFPLACLAWMRRETRAIATLLAGAAAAVWLFSARTWLPDLEVAYAPANVTLTLLVGLGLTWLAAQPIRGAKMAAVIAAIVIGINGAFVLERFGLPLQTARLQAFVDSVSPSINGAAWTSERLAIDRALLLHGPRAPRLPVQRGVLNTIPGIPLVVFPHARARMERDGAWAASFDLPYPSASSLIASLPDGAWLAVARHTADDVPEADRFFSDLFSRLAPGSGAGSTSAPSSPRRAAGVGPAYALAPHTTGAVAETHVDATYDTAPARYAIETAPIVRIVRNGAVSAEARRGAVLAAFDPWLGREETWVLDDETSASPADRLPAIRDGRLLASWVLSTHAPPRPPRVPVVANARVDVRFDRDGAQWFGTGWHGPEGGPGAGGWFRWTNAPAAHVHVLVNQRQTIRIRMKADVASAPGQSNSMKVMWNGEEIEAHPSNDEWTFEIEKVKRGLNVFTIQAERAVVPAASVPGGDPRPLGVAVRALSFEPVRR